MNKVLSKWINDEYCVMRVIAGSDPNDVKNRYAFIEKTARIKIDSNEYGVERIRGGVSVCSSADHSNLNIWVFGPKGTCGGDEETKKWCDNMLIALGWRLE
jgi:hypothetical protein